MPSTSSSAWLFIASPFSRVQQLQQFFLWVSAEPWGEAGQTQPLQSCSLCSAWPHGWGADFIPGLPEIKDALSHPAMQRRPVPLALAQTLLSSSCSPWLNPSEGSQEQLMGSQAKAAAPEISFYSPFPSSPPCTALDMVHGARAAAVAVLEASLLK